MPQTLKQPINILIDHRERSEEIRQVLQAIEGTIVETQRLPLGDYQIDGRILFERKTLHDFAISVIDGRLFRQMTRLASSSLKSVLVLEGRSQDLQNTNIRREALQGALITTSLILGIPVLRSFGPEETARLMVYAARQVEFIATGGLPRSGYRPRGKRKQQLYILQSLPGVGPARAARLLDHFGSVQKVLTASMEHLLSVEGIGKDTAEKIKWVINDPQAAYGIDVAGLF